METRAIAAARLHRIIRGAIMRQRQGQLLLLSWVDVRLVGFEKSDVVRRYVASL